MIITLIKDNYLRWALIASFMLLLISFSWAYVAFADVEHLLIIHFDSFRGIDFLGNRSDVFQILWLGLLVNIINFSLVAVFYWRERFLAYLIGYFSSVFSLLILIATAVIISIN